MTSITPPPLPRFTELTGTDAGIWGGAICQELKAPVNAANVYTFAGWFREEGGGGQNNPMNSTEGAYPDTPGSWNVDGVKDYPTPVIGVAETVATLNNGLYPNIIASFRAGIGLEHPNAETAYELGRWSGGGYHSISPVVVPIPDPPPPPKSMHYEYYDAIKVHLPNSFNSERAVVRNYDEQRTHPIRNRESLAKLELNLAQLVTNLENVMAQQHDPHGLKYHRAYRLPRLRTRATGGVVKPT